MLQKRPLASAVVAWTLAWDLPGNFVDDATLCISLVMAATQACELVQKKKKGTPEIDTNDHIYANYTSIKVDLDTVTHAGYNAESLVRTSVFEVVVGRGVRVSVLPGSTHPRSLGPWTEGTHTAKRPRDWGVSGCGAPRDREGTRALGATKASSDSSQRG